MPDQNDIASLPEFFRRVRQLKGHAVLALARVAKLNAANASRLERVTLRPTPDTLDRMAHPSAWGCPWWGPTENRRFLRRMAVELTGSREYGTEGMYFVRPIIPIVREHWFVSSAAREVVELWPALGLPGWRPGPNEPAGSVADPVWYWAADEAHRLGGRDAKGWDARWTAAARGDAKSLDYVVHLIVSHVSAGATRLANGWQPEEKNEDERNETRARENIDWWERYHERVLNLPRQNQLLVKMLIDQLTELTDTH